MNDRPLTELERDALRQRTAELLEAVVRELKWQTMLIRMRQGQ